MWVLSIYGDFLTKFLPMSDSNSNEQAPIDVLIQQINSIEQARGHNVPELAALYANLANEYQNHIAFGKATDLIQARKQTINYFNRAITLQAQFKLEVERITTLNNLGNFYNFQGYLRDALRVHQHALEASQSLADSLRVAISQNGVGSVLYQMGEYKNSIAAHQSALKIARRMSERAVEAKALYGLGLSCMHFGRYEESLDLLQQALEISKQTCNQDLETAIYNGLGLIHGALENKQQSTELYKRSLQLARQINNYPSVVIAMTNLSAEQPEQAITINRQALTIAKRIGHCFTEAVILINLGCAYQREENKESEARLVYEQALELSQQMGTRFLEAAALCNLAGCLETTDGQKGNEYYRQAYQIAEQIGDKQQEARILLVWGNLFSSRNQSYRAIDLYRKAVSIAQQIGIESLQLRLLNVLGTAYSNLQQFQPAIYIYNQALLLAQKIEDNNEKAEILSNLGQASTQLKQYAQAVEYFQRSLEILQPNDAIQEYQNYLGIGFAYISLNQRQQGIEFFHKSINSARKAGATELEARTFDLLGGIYQDLKQIPEAIENLEIACQLFQQLNMFDCANEASKKIRTLKSSYT